MVAAARLNQRYRLLRPLGRGAEADVYLALDGARDDAPRALKVVRGLGGYEARGRLAGEFRRLAALAHPQLVRVYDLEVADGEGFLDRDTLFFTADFVDGRPPNEALATTPERRKVALLLGIAEDIASALGHVHANGLVHHDVKPTNILVSANGRATLLDLGLSTARAFVGAPRGTPVYMAAEAFAGAEDPRTDLYALGATLYEAASGRPPFSGSTPARLVRAILEEPLPGPRLFAPWLPEAVERVILKLLARAAEHRHSSAAVLLEDLARVREACGLGGPVCDPELREKHGGRDAIEPAVSLLPVPVIGRDGQLAALEEAIASWAGGAAAPAVVLLTGGPGSGKTRLLEESVRRHQLRVAAGRAGPIGVVGDTWSRVTATLALAERAPPQPIARTADRAAGDAREPGSRTDAVGDAESALTEPDPVLRARLPSLDDAERARAQVVERVAVGLGRRAMDSRVLVHLSDAGSEDRSARLLALALAEAAEPAGTASGPNWMLIVEVPEEPAAVPAGALVLRLPPLSAEDVREVATRMIGRPVDGPWADILARATGGVPRLVVETLRAAANRAGVERSDTVPVVDILGTRGLIDLIERRMQLLPTSGRALVEALAVLGVQAPLVEVASLAGTSHEDAEGDASALAARGILRLSGGLLAFPSAAHAQAAYDVVPPARRTQLHRSALKRSDSTSDPRAVARHLAVVGHGRDAARTCLAAAAAARAEGDLVGAYAHVMDAARLADGSDAAEAVLEQAELAIVLARYDDAIGAARKAAAARDPGRRRRAERLIARALQRRGDLDGAAQILGRLLKSDPRDEEARGALAKVKVARASYRDALEIAGAPEREPPLSGPLGPGRPLRLEAAGLAALYSGDLVRAEAAFGRLEAGARAAIAEGGTEGAGAGRALLGRSLSLQGLVAHARGDMSAAADRYAEALVNARAAGDVHAAAVYALNRSTALAERGLFGEVLTLTAEAIRDFRRLGHVAELAAALHNRGIALLAFGDLDAARRAAAQATTEAQARGLPHLEVYAAMLDGDVARREGAAERALEAYDRAMTSAQAHASAREVALAATARAEVLAELGRAEDAAAALAAAEGAAAGDDDRDRVALAAARVALATGAEPLAALGRLLSTCRRAREGGRLDLAWRAEVATARLKARSGDLTEAAELLGRARATWASLWASAPEARRDGLRADPDARALAAFEAELAGRSTLPRGIRVASGGPDGTAPLGAAALDGTAEAEARLRRLLLLSKRLNSELRLEPLLDDIIDTVIELTCAERGFLLLRGEGGRLEIRVARNIDQRTLEGEELAVSRSIAERAALTGEPVLTVDAAFDERFGGAASVSALKLRSVLAVPLRVKGTVVGTIYVDHRFRRGAFAETAVDLVLDLADIAAIALANAQLADENEKRRAEIADLNARLEAELERQRAELDGARAALQSSAALELRYPYDALIGRSPRMLELLRLVDRATATALPVVIYGESGTGKELVARALHQNGARRERPFVPINCAAVPEPLLEAELFGHVRGAFTGADRDRRGLFEVADGGTLFLDEIADTSPGMQTKLLRVLQAGEIRRVGGERPRTVDVRVVAASNRDLRRLVDEGKFREDLFYRLHVIRIEVPALRERSEDIPALVTHFLKKLAGEGGTPKRLDRAAMGRLLAYPWPGNVRELENELLRAAALGGEVVGVTDLSPAVAAADPTTPPTSPDDLSLKPRVEHLERSLLREALARAGGNQTAAAKLLGLSRFGLQKKLRRYGL